MANITVVIPPQNFEIIRDRIAEIAAEELAYQAAISYDDDLIITDGVYIERAWPFDQSENCILNVLVKGGKYDNKDQSQVDGTYMYVIDTYVAALSTENERGDKLARLRMEKIFGKLRYIFSDPVYRTLGFAPPFLCTTMVEELLVKPGSEGDAENVMTCRLHLTVRVPETVELLMPRLMDGYETQVKMSETELGYKYSS